jgi:hypothetical protein
VSFDDDVPSLLATLESRMSREEIADALGIEERDLDEIASGYAPGDDVAKRLRALAASPPSRRTFRVSTKAVVAFIVADALFFVVLAVVLLLAR